MQTGLKMNTRSWGLRWQGCNWAGNHSGNALCQDEGAHPVSEMVVFSAHING